MDKKSLKRKEMLGVLFIFLLGSLMHFVYDWSGQLSFVGLFTPVNESVWEHLKLVLWPTLIYSIYEYISLKNDRNNFFTAKLLDICIAMVFIVVIFYSYTSIVGHSILFIDILTFLIAVILGQIISYKIMSSKKLSDFSEKSSFILIIIIIIIFMIFTFNPPHIPIFKDPTNGTYGV